MKKIVFPYHSRRQMILPTSIDDIERGSSNLRTLVIVFGYVRSGSQTLKTYLIEKDAEILHNDGYFYLTSITGNCFNADADIINETENETSLATKLLESMLAGHNDLNDTVRSLQSCLNNIPSKANAIFLLDRLTLESLDKDPFYLNRIRQTLQGVGWRVVPVVPYRRFYSWLPSFMEYVYLFMHNYSTWDLGIYLPRYGFSEFQSYVRKYGSFYSLSWGENADQIHPAESIIRRLHGSFSDVVLFNMHAEHDNFVASFYCEVLKAQSACQHRRKEGSSLRRQKRSTFNYELLVETMHNEYGLILESLTPIELIRAAKLRQSYLNRSDIDFPLNCPSKFDNDWLIEASLKFESRLLPKWASKSLVQRSHKQEFIQMISSRVNCVIDTAKIAVNEEWRNFMRSRNRRNINNPRINEANY